MDGKVPDPRNLFRSCDCHGLGNPRELTRAMVDAEILICLRKIEELKLKAPEMRRQHLKNRLQVARDNGQEEKAAEILRILHREASRKR